MRLPVKPAMPYQLPEMTYQTAGNDLSTAGNDLSVMPGLTGHLNPKTMQKKAYIYFMTNQTNKVLYTGVTNSLKRRVREHFEGHGSIFTSKYNCNKLVYFEQLPSIEQAIAREKQIKHFKREWKNQLVDTLNPQWKDLSHSIIDDPDLI